MFSKLAQSSIKPMF
ncbi:hypothetical protein [Escherichia coli]|nr:hypothetical protein [Escherichia coli]MDA7043043.1 hypothetical protein [Escherichia coli]